MSAGATPTASGPSRLWPGEPPASSPAYDYGEAETEVVKGVRAPGDDIRKVDPVAVVRAEIAAHPEVYSGADAVYGGTTERMARCGTGGYRAGCPVLKAYYRDLTGDGRDDMVLGFRLVPGNQTAVRMYTFQADRLVQVLASDDAVLAVELAGRTVMLGNLVANAHKHGEPPVVLAVEGAVVSVRDHGRGFPEYLVTEGPQRFRTEGSAKGHGLGLMIAVGQAEVLGARIGFENVPGGGASAVLRLREGGDRAHAAEPQIDTAPRPREGCALPGAISDGPSQKAPPPPSS